QIRVAAAQRGDRIGRAVDRIVDVRAAASRLELLAEGGLPDVTRARRAKSQVLEELNLGADLPAVDRAAGGIVRAPEREIRVDTARRVVGRPDRQVELAEPLRHIELARGPAGRGEEVER